MCRMTAVRNGRHALCVNGSDRAMRRWKAAAARVTDAAIRMKHGSRGQKWLVGADPWPGDEVGPQGTDCGVADE